MNVIMKNKFFKYIENLQDTITSRLEMIDGTAAFKEDVWERPEGGGGRTRVIENGSRIWAKCILIGMGHYWTSMLKTCYTVR